MSEPAPDGASMRQAVELAALLGNREQVGSVVLRSVCVDAMRSGSLRALIGQAALCGAIADVAESIVDAALADVELLATALACAEDGQPLTAHSLGVSRAALLHRCGLAAAKLGT